MAEDPIGLFGGLGHGALGRRLAEADPLERRRGHVGDLFPAGDDGREARVRQDRGNRVQIVFFRYPRDLSGGQRQRVAMGRALQRDPRLFLFDEPLSNLDAQLRVAMRAEIKALHSRLMNTVVYVTHDQIEAMTMADRIVVMRDGRIEQEGRGARAYDRPANVFVAVGSPAISFLRGRVEAGTLWIGGLSVPVAAPEEEVVVGIRPAEGGGGLEVEVQVIEPMGPETHLLANVVKPGLALDQATDAATDVRAVLRRRVNLRPGDRQRLRVDPEALHLFHPGTGARLDHA